MVLTAIRPEHELYQVPLRILPGALDMANIQSAWYEKSFGQFFFNSAVNSVLSVLFSMPIGILAGYAFSRFEIRHSKYYRAYVLFAYMVPIIILVVPFYLIAVWLNIYNTRIPCAGAFHLCHTVRDLGHDRSISSELPRRWSIPPPSMADRMKTLIYILAPMIQARRGRHGLADVHPGLGRLHLRPHPLDSETLRTLPLAIGYLSSDYELTDGLMMAMGTITTLPILLLFVFFQKYFVGGMTSGAVGDEPLCEVNKHGNPAEFGVEVVGRLAHTGRYFPGDRAGEFVVILGESGCEEHAAQDHRRPRATHIRSRSHRRCGHDGRAAEGPAPGDGLFKAALYPHLKVWENISRFP